MKHEEHASPNKMFEDGRVNNDIYLISRGLRECAWHSSTGWNKHNQEYAEMFGVKSFIKGDDLFLYKRPHQLKIFLLQLELVEKAKAQKDAPLRRRWGLLAKYIAGKLLGYSEESMEEYLEKTSPKALAECDELIEDNANDRLKEEELCQLRARVDELEQELASMPKAGRPEVYDADFQARVKKYYDDGHTYRDTAKYFGISTNTVGRILKKRIIYIQG